MIPLLLGVVVLFWPIAKLLILLYNKQVKGDYFSGDKRILIPKFMNNGNGLNGDNRIGFTLNVLLGLILIICGLFNFFN